MLISNLTNAMKKIASVCNNQTKATDQQNQEASSINDANQIQARGENVTLKEYQEAFQLQTAQDIQQAPEFISTLSNPQDREYATTMLSLGYNEDFILAQLQDKKEIEQNTAKIDNFLAEKENEITQKYLSRPASECTEEEINNAYALNMIESLLSQSRTGLQAQDESDGILSEGYDWIKEVTDLGISQSDVEEAIKKQEDILDELKETLANGGDFAVKYEELTGVKYDPEKIAQYHQKTTELQFASMGIQKTDAFSQALNSPEVSSNPELILETYIQYYNDEELAREKFCEDFVKYGKEIGYCVGVNEIMLTEDNEIINVYEDGTTELVSNLETISPAVFKMFGSEKFTEDKKQEYIENLEQSTGIKYKELVVEQKELSKEALGEANAVMDTLNSYIESQEGFIDKINSGMQICGMGLMIVGGVVCFVPGGKVLGAGMIKAGQMMSISGTFGDEAMEIFDTMTNENSFKEDKNHYIQTAKDFATDAVLFASGYGIGNFAGMAGNAVLTKSGSAALSKMTDLGLDASMSILTDLIITGEFDLKGEGISQFLSILTGNALARSNSKGNSGTPKQEIADNQDIFIQTKSDTSKTYGITDAQNKTELPQDNISINKATQQNTTETKHYTQEEKITQLQNLGISSTYEIAGFAKLDDSSFENACKLLEGGVESFWVKQFASDEATLDRATKLYENGIKKDDIFYYTTEENYQRAMQLSQRNVSDDTFFLFATDEAKYDELLYLTDKGITTHDAERLCTTYEQDYETINLMVDTLASQANGEYAIKVEFFKESSGYEIHATKTSEVVRDYDFDPETAEPITITKQITVDEKGIVRKSTTEKGPNGATTWYYGTDNTTIISIDKNGDTISQIEIISNEAGEPSTILHTKPSDALEGAYETTRYTLEDYPEDFDILSSIQQGTIDSDIANLNYPKGTKTSGATINPDGSISYFENHEYNNTSTNRNYTETKNANGEVTSYEYSYQITNAQGGNILNVERNWRQNPDGTTTTTINDVEYRTYFDDSTSSITIESQNGTTKIDLSQKCKPEELSAFYEFCKTVPADQLKILNDTISEINIVDVLNSSTNTTKGILNSGQNMAVLAHELGHNITDRQGLIFNKELIDIYKQEMEAFANNYTQEVQSVVEYFMHSGGGETGSGLNEFISETSILLTTYGNNVAGIEARVEYLAKYFPNTIAKVASLLGY